MPGVTLKLIQRLDKRRADRTAPIVLRVTVNRRSKQTYTGIYVEQRHWNDDRQQVRGGHPLAVAYNAKLQALLNDAHRAALDVGSAEAVVVAVKGTGGSFTDFFEQYIRILDEQGAYWQWKHFRTTLGNLRACLGHSIDWNALDRIALTRFERYLRETVDNAPNTVAKKLSRLRRVVLQALREGVIRPDQNPFMVFDRPHLEQPSRRKLSIEEIKALEAATLPSDSPIEITRDVWMFCFYAGGMRFGDVCLLKVDNIREGRVEYRQMKTSTLVSNPLPSPALALVERYQQGAAQRGGYLFPLLRPGDERDGKYLRRRINSRNAASNVRLKKVAGIVGIEPEGLSFHVARHSYADYARQMSGDIYAVSKALGHAHIQTTQTYLKPFDKEAVDRLATILWGERVSPSSSVP